MNNKTKVVSVPPFWERIVYNRFLEVIESAIMNIANVMTKPGNELNVSFEGSSSVKKFLIFSPIFLDHK